MRLDSFSYRLLWNIKRILKFRNKGPFPIIWKTPRRFEIPNHFRCAFSEDDNKRLNLIQDELERLSRIYKYLPDNITLEHWKQLLNLRFLRERFDYVTFLRHKELQNAKDIKKRNAQSLKMSIDCFVKCNHESQKNANKLLKEVIIGNENEDEISLCFLPKFLFCSTNQIIKWNRQIKGMRYLTTSLCDDETPKVIIDCRFLAMHSFRGMNLTLKQLNQLVLTNQTRAVPWPIFFTNFDDAPDFRHLSIIENAHSLTLQVTSDSYINLFPKQYAEGRLIYLSPHAVMPLKKIEADNCYIIGGIVDRVAEPRIPNKASLQLAEAEGLPCFRLPIDEHINWKRGNKMLTITAVAAILADAYQMDSNWKDVLLRNLPVRKLTEDRNEIIQLKYKNLSIFKREVMRIMFENSRMPDPPIIENGFNSQTLN